MSHLIILFSRQQRRHTGQLKLYYGNFDEILESSFINTQISLRLPVNGSKRREKDI